MLKQDCHLLPSEVHWWEAGSEAEEPGLEPGTLVWDVGTLSGGVPAVPLGNFWKARQYISFSDFYKQS